MTALGGGGSLEEGPVTLKTLFFWSEDTMDVSDNGLLDPMFDGLTKPIPLTCQTYNKPIISLLNHLWQLVTDKNIC